MAQYDNINLNDLDVLSRQYLENNTFNNQANNPYGMATPYSYSQRPQSNEYEDASYSQGMQAAQDSLGGVAKPQDDEPKGLLDWMGKAAVAGGKNFAMQGAGIASGLANFAGTVTNTDFGVAKGIDQFAQENFAPKHQWTWEEIKSNPEAYATSPEGLAADAIGMGGSMLAMNGVAAALTKMIPLAFANQVAAKGFMTGMSGAKAGGAMAKMCEKMNKVPVVGKYMDDLAKFYRDTEAGNIMALGQFSNAIEAMSEGGSAAQEYADEHKDSTYADRMKVALGDAGLNLTYLVGTDLIGDAGFAKFLKKAGGEEAIKEGFLKSVLKNSPKALGAYAGGVVKDAYDEGAQSSFAEYAKGEKENLLDAFNPFEWSDEAKVEAVAGGAGALVFGGPRAAAALTRGKTVEDLNRIADEKTGKVSVVDKDGNVVSTESVVDSDTKKQSPISDEDKEYISEIKEAMKQDGDAHRNILATLAGEKASESEVESVLNIAKNGSDDEVFNKILELKNKGKEEKTEQASASNEPNDKKQEKNNKNNKQPGAVMKYGKFSDDNGKETWYLDPHRKPINSSIKIKPYTGEQDSDKTVGVSIRGVTQDKTGEKFINVSLKYNDVYASKALQVGLGAQKLHLGESKYVYQLKDTPENRGALNKILDGAKLGESVEYEGNEPLGKKEDKLRFGKLFGKARSEVDYVKINGKDKIILRTTKSRLGKGEKPKGFEYDKTYKAFIGDDTEENRKYLRDNAGIGITKEEFDKQSSSKKEPSTKVDEQPKQEETNKTTEETKVEDGSKENKTESKSSNDTAQGATQEELDSVEVPFEDSPKENTVETSAETKEEVKNDSIDTTEQADKEEETEELKKEESSDESVPVNKSSNSETKTNDEKQDNDEKQEVVKDKDNKEPQVQSQQTDAENIVRTAVVVEQGKKDSHITIRKSGYKSNKEFEDDLRGNGYKVTAVWAKDVSDSEIQEYLDNKLTGTKEKEERKPIKEAFDYSSDEADELEGIGKDIRGYDEQNGKNSTADAKEKEKSYNDLIDSFTEYKQFAKYIYIAAGYIAKTRGATEAIAFKKNYAENPDYFAKCVEASNLLNFKDSYVYTTGNSKPKYHASYFYKGDKGIIHFETSSYNAVLTAVMNGQQKIGTQDKNRFEAVTDGVMKLFYKFKNNLYGIKTDENGNEDDSEVTETLFNDSEAEISTGDLEDFFTKTFDQEDIDELLNQMIDCGFDSSFVERMRESSITLTAEDVFMAACLYDIQHNGDFNETIAVDFITETLADFSGYGSENMKNAIEIIFEKFSDDIKKEFPHFIGSSAEANVSDEKYVDSLVALMDVESPRYIIKAFFTSVKDEVRDKIKSAIDKNIVKTISGAIANNFKIWRAYYIDRWNYNNNRERYIKNSIDYVSKLCNIGSDEEFGQDEFMLFEKIASLYTDGSAFICPSKQSEKYRQEAQSLIKIKPNDVKFLNDRHERTDRTIKEAYAEFVQVKDFLDSRKEKAAHDVMSSSQNQKEINESNNKINESKQAVEDFKKELEEKMKAVNALKEKALYSNDKDGKISETIKAIKANIKTMLSNYMEACDKAGYTKKELANAYLFALFDNVAHTENGIAKIEQEYMLGYYGDPSISPQDQISQVVKAKIKTFVDTVHSLMFESFANSIDTSDNSNMFEVIKAYNDKVEGLINLRDKISSSNDTLSQLELDYFTGALSILSEHVLSDTTPLISSISELINTSTSQEVIDAQNELLKMRDEFKEKLVAHNELENAERLKIFEANQRLANEIYKAQGEVEQELIEKIKEGDEAFDEFIDAATTDSTGDSVDDDGGDSDNQTPRDADGGKNSTVGSSVGGNTEGNRPSSNTPRTKRTKRTKITEPIGGTDASNGTKKTREVPVKESGDGIRDTKPKNSDGSKKDTNAGNANNLNPKTTLEGDDTTTVGKRDSTQKGDKKSDKKAEGTNDVTTPSNVKVKYSDAESIRQSTNATLEDYQVDTISKAENHMMNNGNKGYLIANGMGTGKTIVSLTMIKRMMAEGKKNILVVVPSVGVYGSWAGDLKKVGISENDVNTDALMSQTGSVKNGKINFVTITRLQDNDTINTMDYDAIFVDECHTIGSDMNMSESTITKNLKVLRMLAGHNDFMRGYESTVFSKLYNDWVNASKNVKKVAGQKLKDIFDDPEAFKYALRIDPSTGKPVNAKLHAAVAEEIRLRKLLDGKLKTIRANAEEKNKQRMERTKVVMISGTPLGYPNNCSLLEGFVFNYSDYASNYYEFMEKQLAYEMSDKLSGTVVNGELVQDVQFTQPSSLYLSALMMNKLLVDAGAMSNYSNKMQTDSHTAYKIGYDELFYELDKFHEMFVFDDSFGNDFDMYENYRQRTMSSERAKNIDNEIESFWPSSNLENLIKNKMKTQSTSRAIIEELANAVSSLGLIKQQLLAGHKVVVFNYYSAKASNYLKITDAEAKAFGVSDSELERYNAIFGKAIKEIDDILSKGDTSDEIISNFIKNDNEIKNNKTVVINGKDEKNKKQIDSIADAFRNHSLYKRTKTDAGSPVDVIIGNTELMSEGVSLHDEFGKGEVFAIDVSVPERSVKASQMRYRTIGRKGAKSNGIFVRVSTGSSRAVKQMIESGGMADRINAVGAIVNGDQYKMVGNLEMAAMQLALDNNISDAEIVATNSGDNEILEKFGSSEQYGEMLTAMSDQLKEIKAADSKQDKGEGSDDYKEFDINDAPAIIKSLKKLFFTKAVREVAKGLFEVKTIGGVKVLIDVEAKRAAVINALPKDIAKAYEEATSEKDYNGIFVKLSNGEQTYNLINLVQGCNSSTLPHEVMHFVFKTLLTEAERQKLRAKYRKICSQKYKLFNKLSEADKNYMIEEEISNKYQAMEYLTDNLLINFFRKVRNFGALLANKLGLKFVVDDADAILYRTANGEMMRRGDSGQTKSSSAKQFIGPVIAKILDNSTGSNYNQTLMWSKERYAKNKKELSDGFVRDVWGSEGWGKLNTSDGKEHWVTEIKDIELLDGYKSMFSPSQSKKRMINGVRVSSTGSAKLSSITQSNAELLKFVPQLKALNVVTFKLDDANDSFDTKEGVLIGNDIFVEESVLDNADTLNRILSHEMQHKIQEIEGWPYGGSPDNFNSIESEFRKEFDGELDKLKELLDKHKDLFSESDRYAGKYDNKKALAYIKKKVESSLDGEELALAKRFIDKAEETFDKYYKILGGTNLGYKHNDAYKNNMPNKISAYLNLMGERLARGAGERVGMSEDERMSNLPNFLKPKVGANSSVVYSNETIDSEQFIARNISQNVNVEYAKQSKNGKFKEEEKDASTLDSNVEVKIVERVNEKGIKSLTVDKSGKPNIINQFFTSAHRLANKFSWFRPFYELCKTAEETQEKLRAIYFDTAYKAYANLRKGTSDAMDFMALMLEEDEKEVEYTSQQLRDKGYSEGVIKCHEGIRELLKKVRTDLNKAYREYKEFTETVDRKKLREMMNNKLIENLLVLDVDENGNKKFVKATTAALAKPKNVFVVKYGRARSWEKTEKYIDEERLKEIQESKYINITSIKKIAEYSDGKSLVTVTYEECVEDIGNITGYIPHMFDQYQVVLKYSEEQIEKYKAEHNGEYKSEEVIGTGKSHDKAIKEAERLIAENKLDKDMIYIRPKTLDPSKAFATSSQYSPLTGTSMQIDALAQSMSRKFELPLSVAREYAKANVKETSKNRFFGALQERKGDSGFNKDFYDAFELYLKMSSRYVAMQPCKRSSHIIYEKMFGITFDKQPLTEEATMVRDYLTKFNGDPNYLEKLVTNAIDSIPYVGDYLNKTFGDRSAVAIAGWLNGVVAKSTLGCFNVGSAFVSLSQLGLVHMYLGPEYLAKGMKAVYEMSDESEKLIEESGLKYDIGLDAPTGYSNPKHHLRKPSKSARDFFGWLNDKASEIGDKGMFMFQWGDSYCRKVAILGAYQMYKDQGLGHKEALEKAKELNLNANFSYGLADAPGIFRTLSGTVFGDLMLLFQKYPIKALEMAFDIMKSGTNWERTRLIVGYFLMAGIAGIPGLDWLNEKWNELFGYRPVQMFKKGIISRYGSNPVTKTLLYGVGANFGVDVSRRIGLSGVVPDSNSTIGYLTGVAGSKTADMISAVTSGDTAKALKTAVPMLGYGYEAYRGYSTDTKGAVKHVYKGSEIPLKALGFRTIDESMESDINTAMYQESNYEKKEKSAIKSMVANKLNKGEKLSKEDIAKLRNYNITSKQLEQARKDLLTPSKERIERGMSKPSKAKHQRLIKEIEDED